MYKLTETARKMIQDGSFPLTMVEDINKYRGKAHVISIGDVTTYNLLKNSVRADLYIFDGTTKRNKYDNIDELLSMLPKNVGRYVIKNNAGEISNDLYQKIAELCTGFSFSGTSNIIEVDGEEDLAILPAILFAPIGTWILFGIPNKGMGVIIVDEFEKLVVLGIMKEMQLDNA